MLLRSWLKAVAFSHSCHLLNRSRSHMVQRTAPAAICAGWVRASVQEKVHHGFIASRSGAANRRHSCAVVGFQIHSPPDQLLNDIHKVSRRRVVPQEDVHRLITGGIPNVKRRLVLEQ